MGRVKWVLTCFITHYSIYFDLSKFELDWVLTCITHYDPIKFDPTRPIADPNLVQEKYPKFTGLGKEELINNCCYSSNS